MPAHSKRNTALAFFTNYERSLLKTAWGSQTQHLSRDHFLPFGSCSLCLLPAQDPVACPAGDIFCRECALTNLVSQRAEIKRLEREWERKRQEAEDEGLREDAEVRVREMEEFERVQAGLSSARAVGSAESTGGEAKPETKPAGERKRKFELDEDEILRTAQEERRKLKKEIEDEKAAAKASLPSFWAPSQTPDGSASKTSLPEKPPKLSPLCPASSEASPHNLSLKQLTKINFTEEKSAETGKTIRTCPACRKSLTNVSKGALAIPCGHVLCKSCVDKFMQPTMTPDPHNPGAEHGILRCYVCDENLMEDEQSIKAKASEQIDSKKKKKKDRKDDGVKRGLVELKSDGTGFAGGGKSTVVKQGVAFQC